ncbi:MAG: hypothetical protein R2751_02630 [Bacteroidales bacterium]
MDILVRPVSSKRDMRAFIQLPGRIHRNHANWIPPIYMDDRGYFNKKKNKSFSHCDVTLLLAFRGKKVVGRIMGIINHPYNENHNEKHARFNFLETWEEKEVIEALLHHVEIWARERGMTRLVGPLAFSDKDPQGFLVRGFDEPVALASHCNFSYLPETMETLGFETDLDLVVYKINIPETTPPLYEQIAERTLRNNPDLRLLHFTRRKDLKPMIRPIFTLINETFTAIYGFMPFTLEEMDDFANRYLLLMDPRFIKVIVGETNKPVAFVIGMPDISQGIKRAGGRLLPFGILHVLRAGKRSRQLNLLLGAIDPVYQGRGLDAVMGTAMIAEARNRGMTCIDSHLEMASNLRVRAEMEYLGGEVYKEYRIFGRPIPVNGTKSRLAAGKGKAVDVKQRTKIRI